MISIIIMLMMIITCWVFITGGCSRRGVQRMEVALYSKLVYLCTLISKAPKGNGIGATGSKNWVWFGVLFLFSMP